MAGSRRFKAPTEGDASLPSNVTTVLITGELHATTVAGYLVLCWMATLVTIVLPFAMRLHSAAGARFTFIIVAGGALTPVLLGWVGGYDAFVASAAIVGGLSPRTRLSAVGGPCLASATRQSPWAGSQSDHSPTRGEAALTDSRCTERSTRGQSSPRTSVLHPLSCSGR
jgi:hypothetical protein